jgi:hypothetical protein
MWREGVSLLRDTLPRRGQSNVTPKVRLAPISRFVAVVVTCIVVVHMALVSFNAMPENSLQERAPSAVTDYGDPLFTQTWRLFAPNPIRADRTFWVRGLYRDEDGEEHRTEWVNWTDVEGQLKHTWHPFPPRSWPVVYRYTSTIRGRINDLSSDERDVANQHYVDGDVYGRITRDLREVDMGAGAIRGYLRQERAATSITTAAVQALHPDIDFRAVQFRIGSHALPAFEDRNLSGEAREEARSDPRYMSVGWRAPIDISDEQLAAFEQIVKEARVHE